MRPRQKTTGDNKAEPVSDRTVTSASCIEETKKGLFIRIRVQPGASQSSIEGIHDGALKVRIMAPPVEGAANKALAEYLAKALKIKKSSIDITSGANSRDKRLKISGVVAEDLKTQIISLLTANKHGN